ncbi:MAG: HIT domain-containing protein [Methylomonas sp.]|nr:HIT domain-containing protein [Methylomonas sp.]
MSFFHLHPRLHQDTFLVGHFALCKILLMNDKHYPWAILVPQRPDITEIYQLEPGDRQQLLEESCRLAEALVALYHPDKLNIAAIGNLVPQLHLHHVARYRTDIAWPGPVWGKFAASAYTEQEAEIHIARLRESLQGHLIGD